MPAALDGYYAGLDLGPTARDFDAKPGPYGANLGVRRASALALGGFNPALGRNGAILLSNEETEFLDRLRSTQRVRYVPGACVDHAVMPGRDRLTYVVRRAYAAGRSDAIAGVSLGTAPTLRSLAANAARVAALRGAGEWGRRGAVAGLAWAAEDLGRLRGS
jgi:hypothetical protein